MRIDQSQRRWAIASLAILLISAAVYIFYFRSSPNGVRGGSAPGLLFGSLGFACMIFAGLLGARKRVPVWRIGRAQSWMRGHLWLGFLALPLIFFHGGFHFGGTLTTVLLWLLIITVASGIFGAALQQFLPKILTAAVPFETIYEEIPHVQHLLIEEADRSIEALCGPLGLPAFHLEKFQRAGGLTAMRPNTPTSPSFAVRSPTGASAAIAVAAVPQVVLLTAEESAPLTRFYCSEVRPFLEHPSERRLLLNDQNRAQTGFSGLRTLLPSAAHSTIDDLEDICDEARQLQKQQRLHRWLHYWLLLHIPISLALLVLGAVHAVMALRY